MRSYSRVRVRVAVQAHVCVQETCLDLLAGGVRVAVLADGVSSQRAYDRHVALQLMAAAGAAITTTESLVLSMCGSADHPLFKDVSKALMQHNKSQASLERFHPAPWAA